MALQVAIRSITLNTVTGNQAITGVGFQGKLLLLWGNAGAVLGNATNATMILGAASSSTNRWAMWGRTRDALATSDADRAASTTRVLVRSSTDGASLTDEIDFVSWDADGFTLNIITTGGAASILFYLVLGGADLSNVAVGSFNTGTVLGNLAVTGVGFQGTLALFGGERDDTTLGPTVNARLGLGAARSSTSRWTTAWLGADNQVNGDEQTIQRTTQCEIRTSNLLVITSEIDFVSWDADGFTVNIVTANANRTIFYVALGGTFQAALGSFAQPGATGNQGVTVGFQPLAELFASNSKAAGAAGVADSKQVIGAALSSTVRRVSALAATDLADPTQADQRKLDTLCLTHLTAGTPTVNAEADFVSQDADGFTVNWTTVDATARQQLYLALASAAVVGGYPAAYYDQIRVGDAVVIG